MKKDHSMGPMEHTGNQFHIAVNGPGYFRLNSPDGRRFYTKAGTFGLNSERKMVMLGNGYELDGGRRN